MADLTTEKASQILDRAIEELASYSQITRLSPGSKARTILGIMAEETERLGDILSANIILSLLNGASGIYLDFVGDLVGVSRHTIQPAETDLLDQIIRIFTPSGQTFGSLNSGKNISIPAGTIISTADARIRYTTTGNLTLSSGATEGFTGALAINPGTEGNIPIRALSVLNYSTYTSYPNILLSVENTSAIDTGSEDEEDDFFRFRIQNALISAETSNATALRLSALTIPSVTDVVILNMFRGVGTADLLIDTTTGSVALTTLIQVQNKINRITALGMNIQVRAPKLIGLELTVRPRYNNGTAQNIKNQAKAAMRTAVSRNIADTPLGGSLRINDLAFSIKKAHPAIIDIGRPNLPLGEIVLWRDSWISGRAPLRLPQNRDIELKIDERLTLEGSLLEAVTFIE